MIYLSDETFRAIKIIPIADIKNEIPKVFFIPIELNMGIDTIVPMIEEAFNEMLLSHIDPLKYLT